jgi:hypothetical protein
MGSSPVEKQSMEAIRAAAQKENTYLFSSSLRHSRSFIRSVNDQTPIFETWYAQDEARLAPVKIAEELKKRIAVLTADAGSGKEKRRL